MYECESCYLLFEVFVVDGVEIYGSMYVVLFLQERASSLKWKSGVHVLTKRNAAASQKATQLCLFLYCLIKASSSI